jgi:hypothetical protein
MNYESGIIENPALLVDGGFDRFPVGIAVSDGLNFKVDGGAGFAKAIR